MGWLDTPNQNRQQHVQMIAAGNIRDLDKIHERDRRRKINVLLWSLFIISGILGFFSLKYLKTGYWLVGLSAFEFLQIGYPTEGDGLEAEAKKGEIKIGEKK